jgi:acetoacetyl-CoA synthetase
VVVVRYTEQETDINHIPNAVYYDDFIAGEEHLEIKFEQVPFDHPAIIMFSSGTTGASQSAWFRGLVGSSSTT